MFNFYSISNIDKILPTKIYHKNNEKFIYFKHSSRSVLAIKMCKSMKSQLHLTIPSLAVSSVYDNINTYITYKHY